MCATVKRYNYALTQGTHDNRFEDVGSLQVKLQEGTATGLHGLDLLHLRGLDPSAWEGLGRLSLRWCGLAVMSWWEHVETEQIGDEFLRKALMAIHGRPRKLGLCKTWYRITGWMVDDGTV